MASSGLYSKGISTAVATQQRRTNGNDGGPASHSNVCISKSEILKRIFRYRSVTPLGFFRYLFSTWFIHIYFHFSIYNKFQNIAFFFKTIDTLNYWGRFLLYSLYYHSWQNRKDTIRGNMIKIWVYFHTYFLFLLRI